MRPEPITPRKGKSDQLISRDLSCSPFFVLKFCFCGGEGRGEGHKKQRTKDKRDISTSFCILALNANDEKAAKAELVQHSIQIRFKIRNIFQKKSYSKKISY